MRSKSKNPHTVSKAIREAIDSYPGGICFSTESGKPIIVNRQMTMLISQLTGHTVIEANDVWNELENTVEKNGCTLLRKPWIQPAPDSNEDSGLVFMFPDGKIWRFRRSVLTNSSIVAIQLEATDITDLYQKSEELYNNNLRLVKLHERQKALISDIVQINRDKELLSTKMRIHDELGRCLIATKKALSGGVTDSEALLNGWEEAIRDMTNIPLQNNAAESEAELLKVAELIDCKVKFIGDRPAEKRVVLQMYSAVREALTNAVRHAGADVLTVKISHKDNNCHVVISCNGRNDITEIKEGDGLKGLRKSLEQEGASLKIECSGSVVLIVDLPEKKTDETEGGLL